MVVKTADTGPRQVMPKTVALFVTCVGDLAYAGPPRACVEVLEAMGVSVEAPVGQTCCGQPALNSGYPAEATTLARRWLRTFAPYDAVVTTSGSCLSTVHHAYPRILQGAERQQVAELAAKSWEFTQFVARFGQALELRLDASVTYHDSCHMLRTLRERSSPRELLNRIKGLTLVEMTDSEVCCGFGGTFATKLPDVSVAMADHKLTNARHTASHYLVSADPACLAHLQTRADATRAGIRTRHIAELVRDALVRTEVTA
jgi:L-lactate dehydrogenase complex protein LldE